MNKWWAAGLFATRLIMDALGSFLWTWSDMPLCSKYCEYFIPRRRRLCYLFKRRSSDATEMHGSVVVLLWRGLRQGSPAASLGSSSCFAWSLLTAAGRKKVHEHHSICHPMVICAFPGAGRCLTLPTSVPNFNMIVEHGDVDVWEKTW